MKDTEKGEQRRTKKKENDKGKEKRTGRRAEKK
jgi:hypothetical protein